MGTVNTREKLKDLLPYGMVATKQWLSSQGLSTHAIDNAVKSGVLLSLTTGVYVQYSTHIRWEGVVASLQTMSDSPVHLGGESALAVAGLAHYLPFANKQTIHLYSMSPLPRWLMRLPFDGDNEAVFTGHSTKKLWPGSVMAKEKYLKTSSWQPEAAAIQYSCPEKAILEVLMSVPQSISFEHADQLMQGLVNLSPKKLDALLSACKNVKVKRLFFWLAERNNHQWFEKLDKHRYDLGAGKRVIAKDGKLDNNYMITVPKHM